MWHASVGNIKDFKSARRYAFVALDAVGDVEAGQWIEQSPYAFHVRRRLSAIEQQSVGAPVDIRDDPAALDEIFKTLSDVAQMQMLLEKATW